MDFRANRIAALLERVLFPSKLGPPAAEQVDSWRNGLWGRLAELHVSNEPARRLLPATETRWRPATWRHFRFVLIRHLQEEGAHSLDDLTQDPPEVLGLPLNRQELEAVIDSARRRGEVEALQGTEDSDREIEWAVTERGEKATAHALPWLFARGNAIQSWIAPLVAAVGVFGIGASRPNAPSLGPLVLLSVLIALLVWIGMSVRAVTSGAKAGRRVARDWHRWAEERPYEYRQVFSSFPGRIAAAGAAAMILGILVTSVNEIVGWVLAGVAALCFIRLIVWKERWDSVKPLRIPTSDNKEARSPSY